MTREPCGSASECVRRFDVIQYTLARSERRIQRCDQVQCTFLYCSADLFFSESRTSESAFFSEVHGIPNLRKVVAGKSDFGGSNLRNLTENTKKTPPKIALGVESEALGLSRRLMGLSRRFSKILYNGWRPRRTFGLSATTLLGRSELHL